MAPQNGTDEKEDIGRIRLDPPILRAEQGQTSERRQHADRSVFERAREMTNQCASESLQSRAMSNAISHAEKAARYERVAKALTPDAERTLFVLQECLALGLITLPLAPNGRFPISERGSFVRE